MKDFLIKTVEKFEKWIFSKKNGSFFAILVTITGIISILIASILFYMAEPFTFYSHWISNLGGAKTNSGKSPNGSNIVFSVGLIVMTVFSLPFVMYLIKTLLSGEQKLAFLLYMGFVCSIATALGSIGVAIFDMKSWPLLHVYSATLFFFGACFMILNFSLAMLFNSDISNLHAIFGILMGLVGVIFLCTFLPHISSGENIMGLVLDTSPKMAQTRFWEWMFLFALWAWFLESGIYMSKFHY